MLELVNNRFELDPDLMLYPEFKRLWDRDPTENKREAFAYLSYVFNANNPKSSYHKNYVGEVRKKRIIEEIFPPDMQTIKIKDDKDVIAAEAIYVEMLRLSPLRHVLELAKSVINDISKKLVNNTMDLPLEMAKEISEHLMGEYKEVKQISKKKRKADATSEEVISEAAQEEIDMNRRLNTAKRDIMDDIIDRLTNASDRDQSEKLTELNKLNRAVEEYKKAEKAVNEDEINNVKGQRHIKQRER